MDRAFVSTYRQVSDGEGSPAGEGNVISDDQPRNGTLPPSASQGPVLKSVPLVDIRAVRNPRRNRAAEDPSTAAPDPELDGLARSLGSPEEPRLAEPPVVEEMPDGHFRLCAGERRVEAAKLAGWTDIPCLVYPTMDAARAHTLSLVENIHRAPMHPLEEISALCISRLLANADARGVGGEARSLLQEGWEQSSSSYDVIRNLELLLHQSGWVPERPDVSWKAHLDDLGISMAPWERKRKLRLLNIEPDLQEQLRELDITEAALRALGTLEPDDQKKVVEALLANPALARKVRRVARARRDGFYTSIEDALAEVQGWSRAEPQSVSARQVSSPLGQVKLAGEPGMTSPEHRNTNNSPAHEMTVDLSTSRVSTATADVASPEIQDAVLQILECADRLAAAMKSLEANGNGNALPEPWGTWSRDALDFITGLFLGRTDT